MADAQQFSFTEYNRALGVFVACTCLLWRGAGDDGLDSDDSFDFSGDEQQAEDRHYRVRGVRTLGLQDRQLFLPEIREVRLLDRVPSLQR